MRRGDVLLVDFSGGRGGEIQKTRPAVILTDDAPLQRENRLQVVPFTSNTRRFLKSEARVVLNLSGRMRLTPRDVARVLGDPPAAVVPLDPAVRRAGESGRLPRRGRAARALQRLAASFARENADGS